MIGDKAAVYGEFNYIPMGDFGLSSEDIGVSVKTLQAGAGIRVFIPTGSSKPAFPL
jgi:hypothetical protein